MSGNGGLARALRGAFRFMAGDAGALEDFDFSVEGFWRSFQGQILAALFIIPNYYASVPLALSVGQIVVAPPLWLFLLQALVGMVLSPIMIAVLARQLQISAGYGRYIILANWVSVPISMLMALGPCLFLAGIATGWFTLAMGFFCFLVALSVMWRTARTGFMISGAMAIAIVVAELALNVLIGLTF